MLRGKSAVVTGSTSGIGLAIARRLAQQGANVVLNGFGEAGAVDALRSAISGEYGVRVAYSRADMRKPGDIDEMVALAEHEFGALDILVNNAGIQHTAPVHEFPIEAWNDILQINLSAAFLAIRAALPGMLRRNWGRIVNIASTHGLVASVEKSAYVAAKHGILGLTKVVALETARTGVTCNAICPGWVLTPLVETQINDLAKRTSISVASARDQLLGAKQPSMQFVAPDEIGSAAVFLCSNAAVQIRGIALPVDGGWTAQ